VTTPRSGGGTDPAVAIRLDILAVNFSKLISNEKMLMRIYPKIDYSGRLYWGEKTSRVQLKDGKIRDMGCISIEDARYLSWRYDLKLFNDPDKYVQERDITLNSGR
jgi:hypothetical protein